MERVRRSPFQGVTNIIRFNWHFYVIAIGAIIFLVVLYPYLTGLYALGVVVSGAAVIITTFCSLAVSCYIYDLSGLYQFDWLRQATGIANGKILNIHAGFDETSYLLQARYPEAQLLVYDFYDPAQHTEVSIKRARRAYPPFPGTVQIDTATLPVADDYAGNIYVILSAHEIRNSVERAAFFRELKRVLHPDGKIIVVEHLRDLPNFLAYTVGFFHFLPKHVWFNTFKHSGLMVTDEMKITPFVTAFFLEKNGITP